MSNEISVQKRNDNSRRQNRKSSGKKPGDKQKSGPSSGVETSTRVPSGVEPRKVSDSIQQLEPAAMRLVRDSYNLLDSDGSGAVSKQSLQDMMVSLGRRPDEKTMSAMLERCGASETEQFGFANYLVTMSELVRDLPTTEELETFFTAFETNGQIDSSELRQELKSQGLTDLQIDLVFKRFEKQKGVSRSFDSKSFVSLMGV